MRDEPRQVTTFCPRCGSPVVWSVQPFAGGEQLEVAGWVCSCPLDDDEWDDLAEAAGDAIQANLATASPTHVCTRPWQRHMMPPVARIAS